MVSPRIHATLSEIQSQWSITDLWDANGLITAYEIAEAEANERAKEKR